MDGEGSHEGYPYLGGGQSNQPHNYMSYRENDQTREYTPFPYSARSSRGHSIGQSRDQTPMEDYQNIIYSASRSRSASHFGDQPGSGYESDTPQSLHAMIAQLTNAVKNLSDAQTRFEEELSSIREATQSSLRVSIPMRVPLKNSARNLRVNRKKPRQKQAPMITLLLKYVSAMNLDQNHDSQMTIPVHHPAAFLSIVWNRL